MSLSLSAQTTKLNNMETQLKYMPVFRSRQEEQKILTSHDFGDKIYPLLEIVKEIDRKQVTMRKGKKVIPKTITTFESAYQKIIGKVKCKKIFIDLPVHMAAVKGVDKDVLSFLQAVVFDRIKRTEYMIKLKSPSNNVIPIIFTFSQRTSEIDSIILQEADLRLHFGQIGFRTIPKTLNADLLQIAKCARKNDFLIVDLDGFSADPNDIELVGILAKLKEWKKCHLVILRPAMGNEITNIGLNHGNTVNGADNSLLTNYKMLHGNSFGDYAGIKKDKVAEGGSVSPGFIFYDALENEYYGYKGNPQPTIPLKLQEYSNTIVPAVLGSGSAKKMLANPLGYLDSANAGWQTLLDIKKNPDSGRSAAKFKGISMSHYLHCIHKKIANGEIS